MSHAKLEGQQFQRERIVMSPSGYYTSLKDLELHGLILVKASNQDPSQLSAWIRPRVRRSDFIDVHCGTAVLIVSNVKDVSNFETIATRLIAHSKQPSSLPLALRFGISPFEFGRDMFDATWREAEAALQQTNFTTPCVVANRRTPIVPRAKGAVPQLRLYSSVAG